MSFVMNAIYIKHGDGAGRPREDGARRPPGSTCPVIIPEDVNQLFLVLLIIIVNKPHSSINYINNFNVIYIM